MSKKRARDSGTASLAQAGTGKIVVLDVGGQRYHTTRETLTNYSDCYFNSMFREDGVGIQPEPDGSYFVVRSVRMDVQYFLRAASPV